MKTEDSKKYNVMVMDMPGKSLEDLFQECRRQFGLAALVMTNVPAGLAAPVLTSLLNLRFVASSC